MVTKLPVMLERARANVRSAGVDGRVTVDDGDILALPYADGAFDVVIAEAVTMFVDRERAASELARVTRRVDGYWRPSSSRREPPTSEAREVFLGQVCPGLQFETESDWVRIYRGAGLDDLHTETGPFGMMSPRGFLADEGFVHSLAIVGHVACRPANVRKMTWLMPRMARAVPYLGYILLAATKPA